jgi:SpoVK/Ycf46/Vps4 family AAA+-type ATPase
METKFIENCDDDGFVNRESFKLTDKAKKELLVELDLKEFTVRGSKGLMLWDSLPEKKLFYNEREAGRIAELSSLLREENFGKIRERLARHNMRKGFACLFSGSPGTGKTETVYQIARETQRNIMVVDISAIKGMYVGETEKRMKAVFDDYRSAVSASGRAPILFFNEADAVIGKRIEFTGSSRAVDRMENTMQNIILQELENLDGILIATTNLTKNMDNAFDRRFLYKIEFEKPGPAVRASIWLSMLPEFSQADAETLASRFDFSGGQIENVVRRFTVDLVLTGNDLSAGIAPALDSLLSLCRDESSEKETGAVIGFVGK